MSIGGPLWERGLLRENNNSMDVRRGGHAPLVPVVFRVGATVGALVGGPLMTGTAARHHTTAVPVIRRCCTFVFRHSASVAGKPVCGENV